MKILGYIFSPATTTSAVIEEAIKRLRPSHGLISVKTQ